MAQGTVIHVAPGQPTYAVCVLGTETQLDVYGSAPQGYTSFSISASPGVVVDVAHTRPAKKNPTGSSKWLLNPGLEVSLKIRAASNSTGDQKVQISYYGPETTAVEALLCITGVEISLSSDITRTGKTKPPRGRKDQRTWTWGPRGQGAILLVNCDRDNPKSSTMDFKDDHLDSNDLKEMSLMTLSTKTPRDFFSKHQLVLHVAKSEMDKVRVFQANVDKQPPTYSMVLGPEHPSQALELLGGQHRTDFYVEGLAFPDASFPGLISLYLSLLDTSSLELPKALVFQDSVVFRVAPWIMTPNTQPPKEVYVCSLFENEDFLKSVAALTKKAKCKLMVCAKEESRDDRWMQDEMEIGYIQAPHKTLPVVFDSPRNRGLKDFPVKCMLGPDFGYVTRVPQTGRVTDLDSFGNLEVSPPVTVGKKEYPLGRILIGDSGYPSKESQEMNQALQDFLGAQQVQAPVKLYSDWLSVGHVDEFLSFVPGFCLQGFRLLLASPRSCYKLFQEQLKEGHGEALLFQGVKNKAQQKIKDILSNKKLREHNSYVEKCIDWNREVLKRELGLTERDIVDIPQLFKLQKGIKGILKAEAFFPNMVNMLVLGKHLGIPKPFGPIINGRCCLEEKVRSLLEPLGLHCTFIDDFYTYHVQQGDVHCGTNVRRQPFSFKWWHMVL
ncbi:protein-arginine deiminase type-4 [Hippopotamus amphibius kiboko]|uniref:protein-arginine deiminase type-4 n=1 Tax=Hippopotamus amphibius kiboko TaxID=575201 RepID=UPI0025967DE6|nr:protein-arginine deiminase type-4 [Hippopotamus amphibius kiboko]